MELLALLVVNTKVDLHERWPATVNRNFSLVVREMCARNIVKGCVSRSCGLRLSVACTTPLRYFLASNCKLHRNISL